MGGEGRLSTGGDNRRETWRLLVSAPDHRGGSCRLAGAGIGIRHCLGIGGLYLCLWDLGGSQLRHLLLHLHLRLSLRRVQLWLNA